MSDSIKIKKGVDIKLVGAAENVIASLDRPGIFAIKPTDFHNLVPKLVVREGDQVKAGSVLFHDKYREAIKFTSPVSGEIAEVRRGEKRRILEIRILPDVESQSIDFGAADPVSLSRDQTFFIQAGLFLLIVYIAYRNRSSTTRGKGRAISAESILGALVGFFNGYLIMGALWYFLDINEYPLDPLIIAPSITSPSAQNLAAMPMIVFSGGVAGSGDFLAIVVIILLLFVILAIN